MPVEALAVSTKGIRAGRADVLQAELPVGCSSAQCCLLWVLLNGLHVSRSL